MTSRASPHAGARFKLGDWYVEPDVNRLVRGRVRQVIEPRQMAVLLALAKAPAQTLTKLQLLDSVWPHRFVVDGVLKRAISQLRRALGDDARAPRYIQTVYKVGYRLVLVPEFMNGRPQHRTRTVRYSMLEMRECLAREAICASGRPWPAQCVFAGYTENRFTKRASLSALATD